MKRLREDRLRCGADKYSGVKIMTKDLTVSDKCWHTTIKHSALVLTKTKTSQNNMVK